MAAGEARGVMAVSEEGPCAAERLLAQGPCRLDGGRCAWPAQRLNRRWPAAGPALQAHLVSKLWPMAKGSVAVMAEEPSGSTTCFAGGRAEGRMVTGAGGRW